MKGVLLGLLIGCLSVVAFAQEKPALSAEQQQRAENLALKAQLTQALKQIADLKSDVGVCQSQLGPLQFDQNKQALQQEQAAFVHDYETKNPGWTLDPRTGEPAKKPEPPPAEKKVGG